MIFALDDKSLLFPDPELSEPDGLLAVGGDLTVERLMSAYNNGIFPWFSENDPICWYSPPQRCVIFPDDLIISSNMARLISKNIFEIKRNTAYKEVMIQCSTIKRKHQDGTWITEDMINAYQPLFHNGIAHSIEAWQGSQLVGGLYGIEINGVFCGESMFSKVSNASKVALAWLCKYGGYRLIDCQVPNDHLVSLGAVLIERKEYISMLKSKSKY